LILALLFIAAPAFAQQYNVPFNPRAAPGGGEGEWAKTFDDLHDADHSDWVGYGTITCTENSGSSGDLSPGATQGSCDFTGASQPTHADQWGFMEFGESVGASGPMLRSKDGDMSSVEFAYAARVNGSTILEMRVCDGDSQDADCLTLGGGTGIDPGGTFNGDGDGILFGVANTETNTVLCVWVFEAVGETDYCDSANWGEADYCINDDGSPLSPGSKLDEFINCSGDTTCNSWGGSGPLDLKGYPHSSQLNVRAYSGSGLNEDFSTRTCGGTL
jgi:hypothetical protein